MKLFETAVLTSMVLTACSREETSTAIPRPAEAPSIPADFEVSMWRTECYGTCPVYSVKVDACGHVEYEGKSYVAVRGPSSWEISTLSVARLLAKCDQVRFFDIKLRCSTVVYDSPQIVIEVTRDGSTRRLFSELHSTCDSPLHDDPDVHLDFAFLADSIDELLGTSSRVWPTDGEPAKR